MSALGFIETKGLLAAIEGADAMLKAADVSLVEKNIVGGGLVSITVCGEVAAVKASVDAAIGAINNVEGAELISHHVIARHDEDLSKIISTCAPTCLNQEGDEDALVVEPSEEVSEVPQIEDKKEQVEVAPVLAKTKAKVETFEISKLKKMKVNKLRQIARSLSGVGLTDEEIKVATKKVLIDSIINVTGR